MNDGPWGLVAGFAVVGIVGATIIALAAEEERDAEYGMACTDDITHVRVDDSRCPEEWNDEGYYHGGGTYVMWFPVNGTSVPAVGQRVNGGARTIPKGAPVAKGLPAAGGTVQRGGFGAKAGVSAGSKGGSAGS